MSSQVAEFYNSKNIFVTGGTGFLGISVIEKILRCCPDVKNIYILIRPRKGKNAQDRMQDVINNSVFDKIKQEGQTALFKKLIPVGGDVGEDHLGLSSEDRLALVEHIQIVFHSAATLDFQADLKSTVNINLLGTRRVVEFCQELRNLKALIHVSSAYVNSMLKEVYEHIYPAPTDVNELLKQVKELNDNELNEATADIIKDHPNPYTFTKHLAEHEIANSKLPAVIIRPSMIVGAWKEPIPGWTISKNGPQGFLMGASKGIVRRLPVAKDLIYDYIPVDIVVNSLVIAAYIIERDGLKAVKVYHLTSSTCTPFKWAAVSDKINIYLHSYPLASAIWYPNLKLLPSLFWFRISAFFVHMIPAYILDTIIRISGGRPMLVRLHTNVNESLKRLEKFIFSEWKFYNNHTLELYETLSEVDKEKFTLDIKTIDWETYFIDLTKGVRIYLHNEPLKTLNKAKRKDKILLIIHLLLKVIILSFIWWIVKASCGLGWSQTGMIVPIAYFILNLL
ncbi:PREDICTED: putative fatty acyl-CoA reductase CG8306 [Ceratosolen solmsi marchali]|uniref:Fatty acyl-CoA reductase n=1 Tax=Ceratosolen solmsi marchali TaxID=326594 RepID=A0AAJ7DT21_9HYME|nr:PREDICTED: putative fatty acyl-CoA reductase CG8306 [Ceratosolen solmsi marchali]